MHRISLTNKTYATEIIMRKNTARNIRERNLLGEKSCLVSFVFPLWPRQAINICKCKVQNIICLYYVFMMKVKEEPGVTFLYDLSMFILPHNSVINNSENLLRPHGMLKQLF